MASIKQVPLAGEGAVKVEGDNLNPSTPGGKQVSSLYNVQFEISTGLHPRFGSIFFCWNCSGQ